MLADASDYHNKQNKWKHQMIHKKYNKMQYASKHYGTSLLIQTRKNPVKQRSDRKKFKAQRSRKKIYKRMAFDYDDFMYQKAYVKHKKQKAMESQNEYQQRTAQIQTKYNKPQCLSKNMQKVDAGDASSFQCNPIQYEASYCDGVEVEDSGSDDSCDSFFRKYNALIGVTLSKRREMYVDNPAKLFVLLVYTIDNIESVCKHWENYTNVEACMKACMKAMTKYQWLVINNYVRNNSNNLYIPKCIQQTISIYYEPISLHSKVIKQTFHFYAECISCMIINIICKFHKQWNSQYVSGKIGIMEYTNKIEILLEKADENYTFNKHCLYRLIPSYIQTVLSKHNGSFDNLVIELSKSQLKRIYKIFFRANYKVAKRLNNAYKNRGKHC